MVNDFTNQYAFINYVNYGRLQVLDVSLTGGRHKSYQESSDSIRIYFNHKRVGDFKKRAEAQALLRKLFEKALPECKSDFERYGDPVWKAV